ncbi:4Fe-4S dicluster domain-containing protein [Halodesulfurarchaeum formicicum]|uniref:Anaerobic dimethyl sulfoxide reductase subunit B (DMSO reductase iron-sulfur subunit) n=1 Tax=Halodesulfurarchaeum formicicum TaxID=1873524 RepID=A0A1J1AE37_9EURY|nr:4Fe-4S dicluster domain-containing protein [Halodesulfurarchaeum formicicum]APE96165.1 anaerobic dimethyl sulfoxide reductase subunit B (DMSO reductase iron- sulfur subunit) [Halodesulfurarchaeum formicicum]
MGEQWAFYFDANKCIGCHACTVACKNQNDLDPESATWRRVVQSGQGEFPDYEEISVSISCMHCEDPPCETVCPTGAIEKRDSDGIVTVNRDKCIGCHYCAWSCPYGAPKFDGDNKMQKCHMCLGKGAGEGYGSPAKKHEDDGGEKPACVDTCVGGALKAGPMDELTKEATEDAVNRATKRKGNVIIETGGPTVTFESESD